MRLCVGNVGIPYRAERSENRRQLFMVDDLLEWYVLESTQWSLDRRYIVQNVKVIVGRHIFQKQIQFTIENVIFL